MSHSDFQPSSIESLYRAFQDDIARVRERYQCQIPDTFVESIRHRLTQFVHIHTPTLEQYEQVFDMLMRPSLERVLQEVLLENIHRRYRQITESVSELSSFFGLHFTILSPESLHQLEFRMTSLASLRTDLDLSAVRQFVQRVRRIETGYETLMADAMRPVYGTAPDDLVGDLEIQRSDSRNARASGEHRRSFREHRLSSIYESSLYEDTNVYASQLRSPNRRAWTTN